MSTEPSMEDKTAKHELSVIKDGDCKEAVKNLSDATLSTYLPNMQACSKVLAEVLKSQEINMSTVNEENDKFQDALNKYNIDSVINKAKVYQGKLEMIRDDMKMLHEKAAKLKKRSKKLQQQKEKETNIRKIKRRQELDKEANLIARPATKET